MARELLKPTPAKGMPCPFREQTAHTVSREFQGLARGSSSFWGGGEVGGTGVTADRQVRREATGRREAAGNQSRASGANAERITGELERGQPGKERRRIMAELCWHLGAWGVWKAELGRMKGLPGRDSRERLEVQLGDSQVLTVTIEKQ